ncbi:kinase phosphorylation protein-domain-containing protein [Ephemerocybe angulata]|uniref:Kinase phosphorylation protein-domain-containing protein n=1 Tax=Ephemerocybe angulata TaxID=980116 RepID=A0A8H6HA98_9AGAR|nr:kinase phosphorylation protein-domain-containing protein [Tulosesus angulatus]
MFEPTRGGTRGGQAEFKWSDVSADKDREHYLGHSINAPTGRWQKNKDVHWYNRDLDQSEAERLEEIRKVKELEAQALGAVLGYEPTTGGASGGPTSSSNSIPLPVDPEKLAAQKAEKEERKRLKAERKEEKRRKKEEKKTQRKDRGRGSDEEGDEYERRRSRYRSRSRSPRRSHSPQRPRSPVRREEPPHGGRGDRNRHSPDRYRGSYAEREHRYPREYPLPPR